MAKATINLKSGAIVTVEGSEIEVAALLARLEGDAPPGPRLNGNRSAAKTGKARATPMSLLGDLVEEGFFHEPRELGAVRLALREKGHFYPTTTLSPVMLRLVRKKELRRIKEQKRWMYVG